MSEPFYLNIDQIYHLLNRLNIKYERGNIDGKGRLSILCMNPAHNDLKFGNAYIYTNFPYVTRCYSCEGGTFKKSIIKATQEILHTSYGNAIKFIKDELNIDFNFSYDYNKNLEERKPTRIKTQKRIENNKDFLKSEFNPNDYYYTKVRGITKEFVDKYSIKRGISGKYDEYFITPIIDKINGVNTFEARKLNQYEYIQKYFECYDKDYDELKELFEIHCGLENIKYNRKEDKVYIQGKVYDNLYCKYLLKPKTLYPYNSHIINTIFDYDKLDKNKPLLFSEGLASLCKMQKVYDNCSCVFGVNLTEKQIELLLKFKELWIIPDYNVASNDMIKLLNEIHPLGYVMDTQVDDTHKDFEINICRNNLKNCNVFLNGL